VKLTIEGTLVKLLFHKQTDRGMRLLEFETRCVRRGEIHELVTTDHQDAVVGDRIDRVGFLGFIEIQNAGVIEKGDQVWVNDRRIGAVLGFDDCHFPNHYNILIAVDEPVTASDLGLTLEQRIRFCGLQL
jgi:hypothetical protein